MRTMINVSLDTLKEIVKKAEEELGGQNGTVYFVKQDDMGAWGTREKFYKSSLSFHKLTLHKGEYYENGNTYFELRQK